MSRAYFDNVKAEDTVLEIGASVPERTVELASRCRRLIGVELKPERVPESHDDIEYVNGDWENLSDLISPESIDIAVASHVIEHVMDDLKALDELYRVLKRGGGRTS